VLSITRFRVGFINDASSQPNFFAPATSSQDRSWNWCCAEQLFRRGISIPFFRGSQLARRAAQQRRARTSHKCLTGAFELRLESRDVTCFALAPRAARPCYLPARNRRNASAWWSHLSDSDLAAVAAYVWAIGRQKKG
jgi:hypothetical protein